jgi:2-polyprenyl-3-methyl-5-hydroxy-6-metoxy-1,4-benzoquinol methylase
MTLGRPAPTAPDADHDASRDALAERLFAATLGAFDLLAIQLANRLGLYAALADGRPRTPRQLAADAGIHPRYAREWLEHQAVGGLLEVDDPSAGADERRYRLPTGHAEVLTDPTSLATMAPMASFVVAAAGRIEELAGAYRTGGGVAWDGYGEILLEAQAGANRPVFEALLGTDWVPAMADIDARLRRPGARIADVGCGVGWSTLALARAYPGAQVHGVDLDAWSIERATDNVRSAGLGDRVTFVRADAADPALEGQFDLVTILEAVHDLSRPVDVLRSIRGMLAPGGAVLVVDERVAERFEAPGDELERLMYGYSVLFCLPNSLADPPSAATGTVMRPETLERYAREAGFSSVSVLPVEHDVFRLYRLDA